MNRSLSFRPIAITLFVALSVSYVLCIIGDLLFGWTMYQSWAPLMPGFTWPLSTGGFIIGLLWIIGYSIYVAAIFVYPYNYLIRREQDGEQA